MKNELRYFVQTQDGRNLAAFAEWRPALDCIISMHGTWRICTANGALLCDLSDLPQNADRLKKLVDQREAAAINTNTNR